MKARWFAALAVAALAQPCLGATALLEVTPSVIVGAPGTTVDVPVYITSPDRISIVRITVEFNTSLATLQTVLLGSHAQAAGFTIAALNPNPSFAPKTPGANDNALVILMSPTSSWITGTDRQLAIFRFSFASGGCKSSPFNFDMDCNHTDASTFEGTYLCGSNLQLRHGSLANGCITDLPETITGSSILHQNVPNPFNPETVIGFELESPTRAVLEVFGVDGKRVRNLRDATFGVGPHEVVWDGRDDAGLRVPSGTYYYQLRAGGQAATRAMVLLK